MLLNFVLLDLSKCHFYYRGALKARMNNLQITTITQFSFIHLHLSHIPPCEFQDKHIGQN